MRNLFLAILATFLVGCATPYQPFELFGRGGYSDKRISEDTYHVAFYGNGPTNTETLSSLLFYRTAEIALDQGFDYFEVLDGRRRIPTSVYGGFKIAEHTVRLYKGAAPGTGGRIFYVAKKVKEDFGPYVSQQK